MVLAAKGGNFSKKEYNSTYKGQKLVQFIINSPLHWMRKWTSNK